MTRERLLWLLGLIAIALGAWWLTANTEWADRPVWRDAHGEAKTNPVYATEQLLRKLGMQAEHRDTLEQLPPPTARLVMLSDDWSVVPGRAEQLRQWVKNGGHLVLLTASTWEESPLGEWIPIGKSFVNEVQGPSRPAAPPVPSVAPSSPSAQQGDTAQEDEDCDDCDEDSDEASDTEEEEADNAGHAPSTPPATTARPAAPAGPAAGAASQAAADDDLMAFSVWDQCNLFQSNLRLKIKGNHRTQWAVYQRPGAQALRVGVGQGSVTVLNSLQRAFMETQILQCDHAVLLSSALQAEPGATVWFYLSEKREALVPWLWRHGWIAAVLAALTLAAALWRRAVRFGPDLPVPPRLRRSIAEQVRGMGHYLYRHGSEALMLAQQRALESTATRRLADYPRHPLPERARRIAQATGVSEPDLLAAMSAKFCTRAELPARLQILELARRRLQTQPQERPPQ